MPAPDESSGAGVIEGPGAGSSTGLQQRTVGAPPAVLAAGVGVFALGLLAAIAGARRETDLQRGEVVLFQGRPRKSLLRYASSLGLWELTRRTTAFAVTERRVVVEHGLVRRHTHSIPLSNIGNVEVVAGPWAGSVRIRERGGGPQAGVEIGPLRSPAARLLARTIASSARR